MNVAWRVTAILVSMEERVLVLQTTRTPYRNWQGQSLDMVILVDLEGIEGITEKITVYGGALKGRVGGRIPRCYKCGLRGHIRADFLPQPVNFKERED